jgi:hypothetical protein
VGGDVYESGVNAIASSGTNIYIGGDFGTVGGVPAASLAMWNGKSWTGYSNEFLYEGTNFHSYETSVNAMAFDGADLYVGADIYLGENFAYPVHGVAKWNGTAWAVEPLSLDGSPTAMVLLGRSLYVEGEFQTIGSNIYNSVTTGTGFPTVGSKPSYGLARLSLVPYVSLTSSVSPATPTPSATIQFTRTGATDLPLVVNYSVAGTAAAGVDFVALPGVVTIPSGSLAASVTVQALTGPGAGTNAIVVVDVEDSDAFTAGVPQAATVVLAPSLTLTASWQSGPVVLLQSQVAPGTVYLLQTATNLAPPVNWSTVATNTADGSGRWSYADTNVAGTGSRFYRLTTP